MAGMAKYDLLFNDDGVFLGEVDTVTGTSNVTVTLKGYTGDFPVKITAHDANSIMLVKLGDANYLTGMKAMAANLDATKYPTDYSSIGEKGVVFHDGEKITYSGAFAYSDLLNTSSISSFSKDRTIGYDITDVKGIEESYDSNFAFKLSNEKSASIDYKPTQTVAMSHYHIVDVNAQTDGTTFIIAPIFPIVLGSIDTNRQVFDLPGQSIDGEVYGESATWGDDMRYLYMVNSNILNGGFIHTLQDTHSDYYTPNKTFRYWGIQRFKEGSIAETHDSIYNDNNKTQRITAAMPMYKINGLGTKLTPTDSGLDADLTPTLKPLRESNLWTATGVGLTGDRVPPIESYEENSQPESVNWNQLENIDYRAKNYELLAIGDIYPDSKLRWNNIQAQTKDFSTYGMVIESEGSKGKSISHQNFTGTTNNTNTSDSNYERIEISSSPTKTNEVKRFGIMRLVEATFDWHLNPIDYESVARNDAYDKITNFNYPRMKIVDGTNSVEDYNGTIHANLENSVTFVEGDIAYQKDGTVYAYIETLIGSQNKISYADIVTGSHTYTGEIYIIRQKMFPLLADDNGVGLNGMGANDFKMLEVYLALPEINRDYFNFTLLIHSNNKFDAQNIFAPVISGVLGSGYYNEEYSLFHEAKQWDSSTNNPIWYHPSRVINALSQPTFTPVWSGSAWSSTWGIDDGIQYAIGTKSDLYGKSHALFRELKKATKQDSDNKAFNKPTSAIISRGTYGTNTHYDDYSGSADNGASQGQVAPNITMTDTNGTEFVVCGAKTKRHIYAAPDGTDRTWAVRDDYHQDSDSSSPRGDLFQAQMFIKPRFVLGGDTNYGTTFNFTINDTTNHKWLDFMPDLTGYYLVSEKLDNGNLPSETYGSHKTMGSPKYIGRIKDHTTNMNGDYIRHIFTLDNALNTAADEAGVSFKLMRISETTFEDTPDYFEVNQMFDTGLKYDGLTQNYITGIEQESGADVTETEYLAYQEGLYSMYLLLDVDYGSDANTHIERRTIADADDLFSNGDSLNCWITDGINSIEKNILVTKVTGSKLRFSYEGTLKGYGVVSFGETITIESPSSISIRSPKIAYIGTTFSIGTDVEKAIEEMLEENNIEIDTSERNLIYTGNIVDSLTTSTSISLE